MASRSLKLYDLLPEYIRQKDENLHTQKLLGAADQILDRLHLTLQQYYADNFVDQPDDSEPAATFGLNSQEWLLPYFADLLDVRQVSPLIEGRRAEITNAVRWRQRKGTLTVVDEVSQAVGQWEVVVQEAWKRLAMTPRLDEPLLPESYFGAEPTLDREIPNEISRHPGLPSVTPDFRRGSQAVIDENNVPASQVSKIYGKSIRWRQYYSHGVVCHHQRIDLDGEYHTAAFDDVSKRTPDLRNSDWSVGHFHPRKLLLHVLQPEGFFQTGREKVRWRQVWLETDTIPSDHFLDFVSVYSELDRTLVFESKLANQSPFKVVEVVGTFTKGHPPDDDFDDEYKCWKFIGLILVNRVVGHTGALNLERCAARHIEVHTSDVVEPVVSATNCLLSRLRTATGLARLEYVTLLDNCVVEALQASDCVFDCRIKKDAPNNKIPQPLCVRYSLIIPKQKPENLEQHFNNYREGLVLFNQTFGKAGCGVIHPASDEQIRYAAEDGTEPGAYHFLQIGLRLEAVQDKLKDYLPVGYQAVVIPDEHLGRLTNN